MKLNFSIKTLIYFIICGLFMLMIFNGFLNNNTEKDYKFNGIVQKVTKKSFSPYPTIMVNNKEYTIEYIRWYDDGSIIEVGDSVEKTKGTLIMSLIKR